MVVQANFEFQKSIPVISFFVVVISDAINGDMNRSRGKLQSRDLRAGWQISLGHFGYAEIIHN
jgi:hypothetical protein